MILLGLDVGTTGVKAVVFDDAGTILGTGFREYGIDTDAHGKAEQDEELVWRLSVEVMKQAVAAAKKTGGRSHDADRMTPIA